jgi:hypothetical protein
MNYYVEKRGANHTLHLVLTFLTCGLWAITGWPIAAIMGRKRTYRGPAQPQYYPQYMQQPPPQQPPYPPPGYGPPPGPHQPPPGPYGTPPRR